MMLEDRDGGPPSVVTPGRETSDRIRVRPDICCFRTCSDDVSSSSRREEGGMVEGRFDRIDARLDRLETGQTDLRREVGRLDGRLDGIDGRFVEMRTHMGVLHEDAISRIGAISELPWATKADITKVLDKIDELVGGRIVPLEVAVRSLSRERKARGPRRG
jgi:hypothetical protein